MNRAGHADRDANGNRLYRCDLAVSWRWQALDRYRGDMVTRLCIARHTNRVFDRLRAVRSPRELRWARRDPARRRKRRRAWALDAEPPARGLLEILHVHPKELGLLADHADIDAPERDATAAAVQVKARRGDSEPRI